MFWDGMHDLGGWDAGWMGAGGMMLVWILLAGLGVWAMIRLTRTSHPPLNHGARVIPTPPLSETPRQILDRRFAAGELDVDEYAERRVRIEDETTK